MGQLVANKLTPVVIGKHLPCGLQAFLVVYRSDIICLEFGFTEGRQEHGCQNTDNGDHHKQLDKGEGRKSVDGVGRLDG